MAHTATFVSMSDLMCLSTVSVRVCVYRQAEGRADPAAHWVGETGHPETHAADRGPSERNTHTHTNDGPAAGTHTTQTDTHTLTLPQGVHHNSLSLSPSQDLKQQNRLQSLERQLDEKSSEVQELKRENEDLKERMSAMSAQREEQVDHKHKHKRSVTRWPQTHTQRSIIRWPQAYSHSSQWRDWLLTIGIKSGPHCCLFWSRTVYLFKFSTEKGFGTVPYISTTENQLSTSSHKVHPKIKILSSLTYPHVIPKWIKLSFGFHWPYLMYSMYVYRLMFICE